MASKLTPTSYALLGLLRRGPFSAYELTNHMRRSALAHLWPRAEAGIYREPKNLVDHGFASARAEHQGGRTRTVYSITPAGRRALTAWLREPAEPWRFESEAAVKVFFGDGGDLDALRRHLRALADHLPQNDPPPPDLLAAWLAGNMRFPDQIHYTAMSADLISRLTAAVGDWAEAWLEQTADWQDTTLDDTSARQARAVLEQLKRTAERRVAARAEHRRA
jgi:DNA-binding PadR family transcriptional regulator